MKKKKKVNNWKRATIILSILLLLVLYFKIQFPTEENYITLGEKKKMEIKEENFKKLINVAIENNWEKITITDMEENKKINLTISKIE